MDGHSSGHRVAVCFHISGVSPVGNGTITSKLTLVGPVVSSVPLQPFKNSMEASKGNLLRGLYASSFSQEARCYFASPASRKTRRPLQRNDQLKRLCQNVQPVSKLPINHLCQHRQQPKQNQRHPLLCLSRLQFLQHYGNLTPCGIPFG